MMKKIIYKLLTIYCLSDLCVICNTLQLQASVGNTFTIDNLTYTVLTENGSTGSVSVRAKNQSISGDIDIPSSVKNNGITYSVKEIEDAAFFLCRKLTGVTIPNGVTFIGDAAFSGCHGLTHVTFPDSVTELGATAFCSCSSLPSIVIGNGVTEIKDSAFSHCTNLSHVTIGNSVTLLRYKAFAECDSLENIVIPANVTVIATWAFAECYNLTSVYYQGDVPDVGYDIYDGTPYTLTSYYPVGNTSWKAEIENDKWQDRKTATWNLPVPPKVSYKQKNNTLTLTFTGTLQESTDCKKWTTVSGTQGSYTVNASTGKKFYRSMK